MTTRITTWMAALTVVAALAIPGRTAAQHQKAAQYPYILVDLGTFGGTNAYLDFPGQITSVRGEVIGTANTPMSDPHAPNCFNPDCFVSLGFIWQHGALTKLDSLPDGSSNDPSKPAENALG